MTEYVSSFMSVHCPGLGGSCFHQLLSLALLHTRIKMENVGVLLMDGILWYQSNIHNQFSSVVYLCFASIWWHHSTQSSTKRQWSKGSSANCWLKVMKWPTFFFIRKKKLALGLRGKHQRKAMKQVRSHASRPKQNTTLQSLEIWSVNCAGVLALRECPDVRQTSVSWFYLHYIDILGCGLK